MKYIFILLLTLITLQVQAQTKIIGSTTTAGGDLQGTFPNPAVKNNIINRANLTQTLRDSLLRFRKDTSISVGSGTTNYAALASRFARYNRVKIRCFLPTAGTANIILPTSSDTLKHTEFKVSLYSQDSVSGQINVTGFGGFAIYFDGTNVVTQEPNISLSNRQTVTLNTLFHNSSYYWISEISKDWLNEALNGGGSGGITALNTDVVASGTGAVVATIQPGVVTTAKIADANVTLAKMAPSSVNSSKLVDASVALADMAPNSINGSKVVDYSINGDDIGYSILRAGDATNAILRFANGAVLTTPVNGAWEWDANKLNFTIGGVRKRLPVFNDAAPTGGQLMIGNGADFTLANLTAGYAQTVTSGSGSITVKPDTTLVIPYISNSEIANGTRNGYYWNRTTGRFGHQFYKNGYTALHDFNIGTSAYLTDYLYMTGAGVSLTKNIVFGNPTLQIGVADPNRSTAITVYPTGLVTGALYNNVEILTAASPGSTIAITGDYSTTYVTDSDISTLTLPNIIGTTVGTVAEVAIGYTITIVINSATTVTITPNASDSFITNGLAGTSSSITATTGATRVIELIAVGVNTWARKL